MTNELAYYFTLMIGKVVDNYDFSIQQFFQFSFIFLFFTFYVKTIRTLFHLKRVDNRRGRKKERKRERERERERRKRGEMEREKNGQKMRRCERGGSEGQKRR